jgi:hypothetical protein
MLRVLLKTAQGLNLGVLLSTTDPEGRRGKKLRDIRAEAGFGAASPVRPFAQDLV